MSSFRYFYKKDGRRLGPFGQSDMSRMIRLNHLPLTTEVMLEGTGQWKTLADFPYLILLEVTAKPESDDTTKRLVRRKFKFASFRRVAIHASWIILLLGLGALIYTHYPSKADPIQSSRVESAPLSLNTDLWVGSIGNQDGGFIVVHPPTELAHIKKWKERSTKPITVVLLFARTGYGAIVNPVNTSCHFKDGSEQLAFLPEKLYKGYSTTDQDELFALGRPVNGTGDKLIFFEGTINWKNVSKIVLDINNQKIDVTGVVIEKADQPQYFEKNPHIKQWLVEP